MNNVYQLHAQHVEGAVSEIELEYRAEIRPCLPAAGRGCAICRLTLRGIAQEKQESHNGREILK